MGLRGWSGVVGNLSAVTLVFTIFAGGSLFFLKDYFDQAREDRALCRHQVAAVAKAVEKQTEVLLEVKRAIDRTENKGK